MDTRTKDSLARPFDMLPSSPERLHNTTVGNPKPIPDNFVKRDRDACDSLEPPQIKNSGMSSTTRTPTEYDAEQSLVLVDCSKAITGHNNNASQSNRGRRVHYSLVKRTSRGSTFGNTGGG